MDTKITQVASALSPEHETKLLLTSLDERVRRFRRELGRCQKKWSEQSVHDLRVAIRRLVSALDIIREAPLGPDVKEARRALKKHLSMFGPLRDTQTQMLAVSSLIKRFPNLRDFAGHLAEEEERLIKKVEKKMRAIDVEPLVASIRHGLKALRPSRRRREEGERLVPAMVRAAETRFVKVQECRGQVDAEDPGTIHRLRVAFKKFRYTAEVLAPVLGEEAEGKLAAMHDFQDAMGAVQDLGVLSSSYEKFLRSHDRAGVSGRDPVLRELSLRRRKRIAEFLATIDTIDAFWPFSSPREKPAKADQA